MQGGGVSVYYYYYYYYSYGHCFQITFQYCAWDRFKVLDSQTAFGLANFRQLLHHLITTKALSLAILKVCIMELIRVKLSFMPVVLVGS